MPRGVRQKTLPDFAQEWREAKEAVERADTALMDSQQRLRNAEGCFEEALLEAEFAESRIAINHQRAYNLVVAISQPRKRARSKPALDATATPPETGYTPPEEETPIQGFMGYHVQQEVEVVATGEIGIIQEVNPTQGLGVRLQQGIGDLVWLHPFDVQVLTNVDRE